jgi:hypothetical protein
VADDDRVARVRMWWTATTVGLGKISLSALAANEVDTSGTNEGRLLFFLCALVTSAHLYGYGTLLRAQGDGEVT